MAVDDTTLVIRYQNGDVAALETLIARHQARAYQYAYRLTRDSDQACDIIAEAFARICKSLKNFRGQSAFSTWLHRIITNCFLDARKRASSRPAVSLESMMTTDEGEVERQIIGVYPNPQLVAERHEREDRLAAAIERLPASYRTIIVLFHGEMLSYDEIATVLDLPVGTVKSRLNRARIAMRSILERDREMLLAA